MVSCNYHILYIELQSYPGVKTRKNFSKSIMSIKRKDIIKILVERFKMGFPDYLNIVLTKLTYPVKHLTV